MDEIIKELYEILKERRRADCEIILEKATGLNRKIQQREYSSKEEYFELNEQFHENINLILKYIDFVDELEKFKNKISNV